MGETPLGRKVSGYGTRGGQKKKALESKSGVSNPLSFSEKEGHHDAYCSGDGPILGNSK